MWEVDPETKSKLLAIQKTNGNDRCCDCGAPSPQWASPKFGTFICLTCAGIHRGLGVHISFVRSITMDAFKPPEISRMQLGGNDGWKTFWGAHPENAGKDWDSTGIEERYGGDAGEEWKERLSSKVEGREYVPLPKKEKRKEESPARSSPARSGSPASSLGGGKKAQNEAYFAKLGNQNANRSADLPPSQGGKYAGFGSAPASTAGGDVGGGAVPGMDDFQKDPVAALSKGFGWFTNTVGKGAKQGYEGWIQPTAQKLAEADLAAQARIKAAQVAQNIQTGTKGAAEQFNRFVEGQGDGGAGTGGGIRKQDASLDPDKKDFWDSFGSPTMATSKGGSGAIGTVAMGKGAIGKDTDGWGDDDKWDKF